MQQLKQEQKRILAISQQLQDAEDRNTTAQDQMAEI